MRWSILLLPQSSVDLANQKGARLSCIGPVAEVRRQHRAREIAVADGVVDEGAAEYLEFVLREVGDAPAVGSALVLADSLRHRFGSGTYLFCVSPKVTTPAICALVAASRSSIARWFTAAPWLEHVSVGMVSIW